jgi:hypothetical protein
MEEKELPKRILIARLTGGRGLGTSKLRWIDDAESDLSNVDIEIGRRLQKILQDSRAQFGLLHY